MLCDVARQGRWVQLLVQSLDQAGMAGVRAVVQKHLGRPPTRSEMNAARRAAYRLAATGEALAVRHRLVAGSLHHPGDYLVLVRPGATAPDEAALRLAAIGQSEYHGTIEQQRQVSASRTEEAIELAVQAASPAARVDVDLLDESHAAAAAAQLDAALEELRHLRRRLWRRAGRH